jgi:hypothetical protein
MLDSKWGAGNLLMCAPVRKRTFNGRLIPPLRSRRYQVLHWPIPDWLLTSGKPRKAAFRLLEVNARVRTVASFGRDGVAPGTDLRICPDSGNSVLSSANPARQQVFNTRSLHHVFRSL